MLNAGTHLASLLRRLRIVKYHVSSNCGRVSRNLKMLHPVLFTGKAHSSLVRKSSFDGVSLFSFITDTAILM